jgi:hypothetical protein
MTDTPLHREAGYPPRAADSCCLRPDGTLQPAFSAASPLLPAADPLDPATDLSHTSDDAED